MKDIDGVKDDRQKNRYDLLPCEPLDEIVEVLTYGANKYSNDNWLYVPDAKNRYFSALMRHLVAWRRGEANDPETGLSHLAHAGCNIFFLLFFERNNQMDEIAKKTPKDKYKGTPNG